MKHAALIATTCLLFITGCCANGRPDAVPTPQYRHDYQPRQVPSAAGPRLTPTTLLDEGLPNWQKINFGGEGTVSYEDGTLNLDMGQELTGVRYTGDLEALLGESLDNYTITLQAQRVEGIDMFLGLTFPVGTDGHVSLVLGGWAGAVTGISSLDGLNASENSTTQYHAFKDKQWYSVKIRVTDKIECWLDGKKIVDEPRADYEKFDTHGAVVDTKPLGLFTYATWGAVKDLTVWK